MILKVTVCILFLGGFLSQANSQSYENLKTINEEVWDKFYKAFDSLDYQLFAEIHSRKLIRISASSGKITDYENYINNYKRRFINAKENQISNKISLRFFERINNDSIATERGIYKLIRTNEQKDIQIYYGQFHVILIKEKGKWRILIDYDSNYENRIGDKEYVKSHGINEYDYFVKE